MTESEARSRSLMTIWNGTAPRGNGILSEGHDHSGNSEAIRTALICFSFFKVHTCLRASLGIIPHGVSRHAQ